MEKLMKIKTYETKDLYFASYLVQNKHPLRNTREEGNTTYFIFSSNQDLENLKLKYFSYKAKVEPIMFVGAMRRLKRIIHNSLI